MMEPLSFSGVLRAERHHPPRRRIMGKGVILWFLGVPVSVIVALYVFGVM